MTPSEKWMLGLWAVYGIPSFLSGVGITLLFVRAHGRRKATAKMPGILSPDRTFEQGDLLAPLPAPADRSGGILLEGFSPG